MRLKFGCFFCIVLFYGCISKQSENKIVDITYENISLNKKVDSLLQIFLKKYDTCDCQFYLASYLSEGKGIITFITNNAGENYLHGKTPLMYILKNNKKIYLLTGIERLFDIKTDYHIETDSYADKYYATESYVLYKDELKYFPEGIPLYAPPPNLTIKQDSDFTKE